MTVVYGGDVEHCRHCRVNRDNLERDHWVGELQMCWTCANTRCRVCGSTRPDFLGAPEMGPATWREIDSLTGIPLCDAHALSRAERLCELLVTDWEAKHG